MKQETLEEAAERYVNFEYPIAHPRRVAKNAFINGGNWQQENMYSEEEVLKLLEKRDKYLGNWLPPTKWFEQFKKK